MDWYSILPNMSLSSPLGLAMMAKIKLVGKGLSSAPNIVNLEVPDKKWAMASYSWDLLGCLCWLQADHGKFQACHVPTLSRSIALGKTNASLPSMIQQWPFCWVHSESGWRAFCGDMDLANPVVWRLCIYSPLKRDTNEITRPGSLGRTCYLSMIHKNVNGIPATCNSIPTQNNGLRGY